MDGHAALLKRICYRIDNGLPAITNGEWIGYGVEIARGTPRINPSTLGWSNTEPN
jgi:hypothetical protein